MPTIEMSSGIETIITACLHLRFTWSGEHWKHELISDGACQAIPLIWSVGGQIQRESPGEIPNPIFEKIEMTEEGPSVATARLTGRSGQRQTSGTFRVEELPDGVVIDVEVNHSPAELGEVFSVAYLVESSTGKLHFDDKAIIDFHNPESRLVFETVAPARVEADHAGMGTIRLKAISEPDTALESHSFHYRWRWIHSPGLEA